MRGADHELIVRLRQLALVDLDALVAGTTGDHRASLLESFTDDLRDALTAASERCAAIAKDVGAGPDPIAHLLATGDRLAADGSRLVIKAQARLQTRAQRARQLAVLDDASRAVLSRLAVLAAHS